MENLRNLLLHPKSLGVRGVGSFWAVMSSQVERVREEHISVCVRVRPFLRKEITSGAAQKPLWDFTEDGRTIRGNPGNASKSSYAGQDIEFTFGASLQTSQHLTPRSTRSRSRESFSQ